MRERKNNAQNTEGNRSRRDRRTLRISPETGTKKSGRANENGMDKNHDLRCEEVVTHKLEMIK